MRRLIAASLLFLVTAIAAAADPPAAPVLKIPGAPDRPIEPASILGPGRSDVRIEDSHGDVTIFHGFPLLEVLEQNGLDSKTMASQRKVASAVVVVTARDGYAVVFSVGELLMHRGDPRVFLAAETGAGPLPPNEGPVRLVVLGDRVRSPYGLARFELKYLADNTPARKP
jgi:DMSO/TMAO reductase YedYZ molybdopterin-dependent catalytic subunit